METRTTGASRACQTGGINMEPALELVIDDSLWEESGVDDYDRSARLSTVICINRVFHHLEAYAVVENGKTHIQEPADIAFETNLDGLCSVAEPNGHWQTVKIRDRDYVLVVTPFC